MQLTKFDIKVRIVRKLVRWHKWGAAHTENILKGLPRHLRGDKRTKEAIKELVRAGWMLGAKKIGEIHGSLNPRKTKEILQFYAQYCKRK